MARTVLLADDSVTIQKVVEISLSEADVDLVTADHGNDALARFRELRPDLVLVDVALPGMDGYALCQAIKAEDDRDVPVVLLSGAFEAFDDSRADRVGSDAHITKPFEAATLVERVTALLNRERPAPAELATIAQTEMEGEILDAEPADEIRGDTSPTLEAEATVVFERPPAVATPVIDRSERDPFLDTGDHGLRELGVELLRGATRAKPEPLASENFEFALGRDAEPNPESDEGGSDRLDLFDGLGRDTDRRETHTELERTERFDVAAAGFDPPPAPPDLAHSGPAPAETAVPFDASAQQRIHDTLEKMAWEALSELPETLVREIVARVEAIAWEVIPRMADTLIREEIRRLKGEND